MSFELPVQLPVSLRAAGKYQHTARHLVKPVNGPYSSVFLLQHLYQVRGIGFPSVGQHGQSGWFVDHEQLLIQVQDHWHGSLVLQVLR
jgi:hypothetical protein